MTFLPSSIPDTRASFFASSNPTPSDEIILRMRATLTEALRLPASIRWVCDWLFEASDSPFHTGLTLPPESFSSALAVRVSHSTSCGSRDAELHMPTGQHGQPFFSPAHLGDKDAYVLFVPVACMDGVTVGYSFGRGVQHPVPPKTKTHQAGPFANFVGGSHGAFPNFVGRFAFGAESDDMLVVSSELSDKFCGLLFVSKKSDGRRSRHLIAVPRENYGFDNLPSRVMFMMSNEETRVPSSKPVARDDAGDSEAMRETDPVVRENRDGDWLDGINDLGFDFVGNGSAGENAMSESHCGGISSNLGPHWRNDGDADILAADEFTAAPASCPGHQALTPPPLGPFAPLFPGTPEFLGGGDDRAELLQQGAQGLQAVLQDMDPHPFLEQGSDRMPTGTAHGAAQCQDDTEAMGQRNRGAERLGQFLQGGGMHGHLVQTLHGGRGTKAGSQDENGCHADWLHDRSGCYTEWIQKMRDVQGVGELLNSSSTSTLTSQHASMRAVGSHLPWMVSPTGAISDGVCFSRQSGRGPSSSGAFDMSTLKQSLAGLARSFNGSYYDKQLPRDFMHPVSGQFVVRFTGELRATLDGPEPAVRDMLQQTAMHSYYASVLPVNPDARLLTGTGLVWKRTAGAGEGRNRASGVVSVRGVDEHDAESIRAERKRLRRERNRRSAAMSNEKRRTRLEAQETELAELRQRLDLLRWRQTVAKEENAALKQSLMWRGPLVATSESI